MSIRWQFTAAVIGLGLGLAGSAALLRPAERWSEAELETIRSLWIGSLEPLQPDPSNRYGDDPRAAALGHRLFFETRLSSNGEVACATCHLPGREFQDDLPLARGVGVTDRRTMPIAGMAYSPWQFWDGRKDSQWAQALGPLESPVEHGGSRAEYLHVVARHYRAEYEEVFGALPDLATVPRKAGPVDEPVARAAWDALASDAREDITRVYANIGKAIAAYERRIQYGPSRFDDFVAALVRDRRAPKGILTSEEIAGLRLFIGEAECVNCHNGPLFTDNHFHNTGVAAVPGLPEDLGRAAGARLVANDEFNCRSRFSDAGPAECDELDYLVTDSHELVRAFKPPSLRNVADRPPYMHAGQIATLREAIDHYDRAPAAPAGHSELRPLKLGRPERDQLEAFLRALSGPTVAPPGFLAPPR
jgi:cytochrome c peroxidase